MSVAHRGCVGRETSPNSKPKPQTQYSGLNSKDPPKRVGNYIGPNLTCKRREVVESAHFKARPSSLGSTYRLHSSSF